MFEKKGRKRLRRDEHYRPRIIETFRENIFGPLRFKLRKFRSEDFGHYYYELEDSKSGWTCYYSIFPPHHLATHHL